MSDTNGITLETYDRAVASYVENTPQTVLGGNKKWLDALFSNVPYDAAILEIGSGAGRDADYIEGLGYDVERTDGSEGFVSYLKSKGKSARKLNMLTDEIESNSYDVMFANGVLLHFNEHEIEQALKKIHSGLREAGIFGFSLIEGEGENIETKKLSSERYFRYWTEENLRMLLSSLSFRVVEIKLDEATNGKRWLMVITKKETV